MTECTRLSDRMPDVALGRARWNPEEASHLAACDSCRSEWRLVQTASKLGRRLGETASEPRVADAVIARLKAAQVGRSRTRVYGIGGVAAAAAVAALLWTGSVPKYTFPARGPSVVGLEIPLPELDSLQPSELNSVLQTMDQAGVEGSSAETPDPGDTNADDPETVLDYWEG